MENRARYSDEELEEFKEIIEEKLAVAKRDLELLLSGHKNENGTDDTIHNFKPYEEGSEILSKELSSNLATRLEVFIRDLTFALKRIENKNYGICRVTGKLIDKERLKAVPHATLSIEAKNMQK